MLQAYRTCCRPHLPCLLIACLCECCCALQQVRRFIGGSARRQALDRASLDAVSIHQLQAAVAQFAQGEVLMGPPSPGYR
jgi:hypothetical protein